jgi:hypothetical protein
MNSIKNNCSSLIAGIYTTDFFKKKMPTEKSPNRGFSLFIPNIVCILLRKPEVKFSKYAVHSHTLHTYYCVCQQPPKADTMALFSSMLSTFLTLPSDLDGWELDTPVCSGVSL